MLLLMSTNWAGGLQVMAFDFLPIFPAPRRRSACVLRQRCANHIDSPAAPIARRGLARQMWGKNALPQTDGGPIAREARRGHASGSGQARPLTVGRGLPSRVVATSLGRRRSACGTSRQNDGFVSGGPDFPGLFARSHPSGATAGQC